MLQNAHFSSTRQPTPTSVAIRFQPTELLAIGEVIFLVRARCDADGGRLDLS
jgi:hypothetical protein